MFFTNGCPCSCHAGWGVPIYNWKKLKSGKVKTKNGYVQIEKIKTKKLQMKVFEFQA